MAMIVPFQSADLMTSMTALALDVIIILPGLDGPPGPMNQGAPVDRLENLVLLLTWIRVGIKVF